HNREWHAILADETLATLFREYIDFDFSEAERLPLDEAVSPVRLPDVFVPEEAFFEALARVEVKYFPPLVLDELLSIQPLLTPDRDSRRRHIFIKTATEMIERAEKRIYVENQSFTLSDVSDEYLQFFTVLRDKQKSGRDVRIIIRDGREFGQKAHIAQQKLIEELKDFGFDVDAIKLQRRCHTKGIIVDGNAVLLGSHNLTPSGGLFNRDASLLVNHVRVAGYFEDVFLFDWENRARQEADELVGGMRIALPGEPTPPGFRRVNLGDIIELS